MHHFVVIGALPQYVDHNGGRLTLPPNVVLIVEEDQLAAVIESSGKARRVTPGQPGAPLTGWVL